MGKQDRGYELTPVRKPLNGWVGVKAIRHPNAHLCDYVSARCLYQSVLTKRITTKQNKKPKEPIQRDVIEKSLNKCLNNGHVSRAVEINTRKGLFGSQESYLGAGSGRGDTEEELN